MLVLIGLYTLLVSQFLISGNEYTFRKVNSVKSSLASLLKMGLLKQERNSSTLVK